jgi:hypothetical protein
MTTATNPIYNYNFTTNTKPVFNDEIMTYLCYEIFTLNTVLIIQKPH